MIAPVRLTLSRKKGFNLQEVSASRNGLPAVAVSRPSIFGNPFTATAAIEVGYLKSKGDPDANAFLRDCFSEWIKTPHGQNSKWWMGDESDRARSALMARLHELRGKNLACWCAEGSACHADIELELANMPRCEEVFA